MRAQRGAASKQTGRSGSLSLPIRVPRRTLRVTYLSSVQLANLFNGTCLLNDQSLSYARLGYRGMAKVCEPRRMLFAHGSKHALGD